MSEDKDQKDLRIEIEFRDPAPAQTPVGNVRGIRENLDKLKEHPERWAVIARYEGPKKHSGYTIASSISRGKYYKAGGRYEAVGRLSEDRSAIEIFARYMGQREDGE
jgi:hypothetical protein